jgi:hypothetical protein
VTRKLMYALSPRAPPAGFSAQSLRRCIVCHARTHSCRADLLTSSHEGAMDDQTRDHAFVSALTTEHFASQAARSTIISEQVGRAMLYMGAVSSVLITLGFVAQSADLTLFIATVLPALFLLGEFTFAAMVRNSIESIVLLRHIRRIREYYRGFGPEASRFFDASDTAQQFDAAIATFGLHLAPLQFLFSGASTVAAVNAIIGGVGIALLCAQLDFAVGGAAAIGIFVGAVVFGFHMLYEQRRLASLERTSGSATVDPDAVTTAKP